MIVLILTLPLYALFIYLFWLRFQNAIWNIEINPIKRFLMWLNEILFTLILPIIGFFMINDKEGLGTFKDINNNAFFQIPESYKYHYYILSGITILLYFLLRISIHKVEYAPLIKKLAIIPLTSSLFTCSWLGISLGYGFLPMIITLPVISPLVSTLYILLLMKQHTTKTSSTATDLIDEHLLHTNS